MAKVILIACSSGKLPFPAKAEELYTSRLFRLNLQYARSLYPDSIFILSAKHGLVSPAEIIAPYDVTLNRMPVRERKVWAEKVIRGLKTCSDPNNDRFVILAGDRYREFLIPHLKYYDIPLKGLPIGKQLEWLKWHVKDV